MNCPNCGRHMSAWSLGPPKHEPAWKCPDCDLVIVESAENEPEETDGTLPDEPGDEQCQDIFQQVENAPLRKPLGKCVTEIAPDGIHWRL